MITLKTIFNKKYFNKRILSIFCTVIIITLLFPTGKSIEYNVEVGDVWNNNDLISEYYFPVLKNELDYKNELKQAEQMVYPIFLEKDSVVRASNDNLKKILAETEKDFILNRDSLLIDNITEKYNFITNISILKELVQDEVVDIKRLLAEAKVSFDFLYQKGILNFEKSKLANDTITIKNKREINYPSNNFYDKSELENYLSSKSNELFGNSYTLRAFFNQLLTAICQPNLIYSPYQTNIKKELAKSKISKNIGIVVENELIVEKNQRITVDIKEKIDSYKKFKQENAGRFSLIIQNFGKVLHVSVIMLLFIIYIYLFRKRIYNNLKKIIILNLIFVFISLFGYVTNFFFLNAQVEYLIVIPMASMLLTIIFDSRVGFYGTVILALIIGGIKGNNYSIALVNIIAGGLAAYSVRDIKSRNQIYRSILFIFIGYFLGITALGAERFINLNIYGEQLLYALINSIISPILTSGLLVFFEKVFNITTDLTLVELQSPNNELIQMLQIKTPGTYHHSVVMSSLAESSANAIGANAILAKVGAIFHDIGKVVHPEYYVENQKEGVNIHNNLSPEESAQKIISHIEDGLELTTKYKIPQEVIDFIPMHHGRSVTRYFYAMAKKQKKEVSEDLFKYPGPNPNTKETAIVMLADAIESTAKSLKEPTKKELEDLISFIIKERFEEGLLNDCNLTLKELTLIKESFLNSLEGIHHSRIKYPTIK